jgi:hypothetical protein
VFSIKKLEEPEQGGRTGFGFFLKLIKSESFKLEYIHKCKSIVFPALNMGVQPKFGSALFWYNLHRNGSNHERTM